MACANSRCRYKNGGDCTPPPDTSYIDQLMIHKLCCPVPDVVHPAYRRMGIARKLLDLVTEEARAYGCGSVQITASDVGVKLYTAYGFRHNGNFMMYDL